MKPEEIPLVMNDLHRVVQGYYPNNHEFAKCCNELAKYRCKEGLFASSNVQALVESTSAWKCWMMNYVSCELLHPIAMRVLS